MLKHTVRQDETLNSISQRHGFDNYKDAGVESVPSGDFDLIRPGEEVTLGNYQQPVRQGTETDRVLFAKNSDKFDDSVGGTVTTKEDNEFIGQDDPRNPVFQSSLTQQQQQQQADENGQPVVEEPQTELDKDIQAVRDKYTAEADYAKTTLDSLKESSTAATGALIDSITKTYDARIQLMEDANKRIEGGTEQLGIRSGRSRYASKFQQGIMTDTEQKGVARVAALEGEKLSLIAQAEQARSKEDIDLFNTRMSQLDTINDNLQNEVSGLQKASYDALQEMRDQQKVARDEEDAAQQLQFEKSKEIAYGAATSLAGFETPEEQVAFIEELVNRTGISSDILLSDIYESMDEQEKAQLDIENIESLISTRETGTELERGRLGVSQANLKLSQDKAEFNPSSGEKASVNTYLANNGSDEDSQKAKEDPEFFYFILGLVNEEEEKKRKEEEGL